MSTNECIHCGLCCQFVLLQTEAMPSETKLWLNEHPHILAFEREAKTYVLIKDTCQWLYRSKLKHNKGEMLCKIYDKRPDECALAPCIRGTWLEDLIKDFALIKK